MITGLGDATWKYIPWAWGVRAMDYTVLAWDSPQLYAQVKTDFFETVLAEDSYVLLCSDGLSNMVDNSSIFRLVLFPGTLHMKTKALIALANQNGGKDNIAVVLVETQRNEVRRG